MGLSVAEVLSVDECSLHHLVYVEGGRIQHVEKKITERKMCHDDDCRKIVSERICSEIFVREDNKQCKLRNYTHSHNSFAH
jgi:hypothetical protein